jgi:hypothetical protein
MRVALPVTSLVLAGTGTYIYLHLERVRCLLGPAASPPPTLDVASYVAPSPDVCSWSVAGADIWQAAVHQCHSCLVGSQFSWSVQAFHPPPQGTGKHTGRDITQPQKQTQKNTKHISALSLLCLVSLYSSGDSDYVFKSLIDQQKSKIVDKGESLVMLIVIADLGPCPDHRTVKFIGERERGRRGTR